MRRLLAMLSAVLPAVVGGLVPPASAAQESAPPGFRTPRPPRVPGGAVRTPEPDRRGAPGTEPARRERQAENPIRTGGRRPNRSGTPLRSRVIAHGPPGARVIALTLDDGYRPDVRILGLVERLGIRGTAFLTGAAAQQHPWLARRLARAGWEVCSHTWSHRRLTGLSAEAVEREIIRGARAVTAASGVSCRWFRPPYGSVNATVVRVAERLGYTVVHWSASLADSVPASTRVRTQVDSAMTDIRPGAILLGHFGNTHSFEVLREVLARVAAAGYHVGTLTELLRPGEVSASAETSPRTGPAELALAPARTRRTPRDLPPEAVTGGVLVVAGASLCQVSRRMKVRGRRETTDQERVLEPVLSAAAGGG